MRWIFLFLFPLSSCYFSKSFSNDSKIKRPASKKDLLAHKRNSLEWWYFANHIKDETGNEYGLMFTVFKRYTLFTGHVWMLNRVLSDKKNGDVSKWVSYLKVPPRLQRQEKLNLVGENYLARFKLTNIGGDSMQLEFTPKKDKDIFPGFVLLAAPGKKLTKHGQAGYMDYGAGREAGYLSFTDVTVNGKLFKDKDSLSFTGNGWFDKQWNCIDISKPNMSWKWLCVQLENKTELMLFSMYEKNTKQTSIQGTMINVNGNETHFAIATDDWLELEQIQSEKGKKYPTKLKIELPNGELEIECPKKSHEVNIRAPFKNIITYSEAPAKATLYSNGVTILGKAFLECTNTDK